MADIAVHLRELKARATAMLDAATAEQRGYFKPGEDEAARGLLVSYCQARAALYDIIHSLEDVKTSDEQLHLRGFAVAYAAAALLVDAARFMRESFADRPHVIAKLNEAEPAFGIPGGTYDMIQKSLTQPRNVWRLHQANLQYEQLQEKLDALRTDDLMLPVLQVIDELSDRMSIDTVDLVAARVDVRTKQLMDGVRHAAIGVVLYAIQEWVGDVAARISVWPKHRPRLPRAVDRKLCAMMQPGDVIVVRKQYALTNYFLPGYWPHAALYLGTPEQLIELGLDQEDAMRDRWARLLNADAKRPERVLEAMKDGVQFRSVLSPWASDCVVVIRPNLSRDELAAALARGLRHEGKPYDFDFDFSRADRMVCTEVVYRTFDEAGPIRFTLTPRAGRLTLAAEDLLRMAIARDGFTPVAMYAAPFAKRIVTGDAVDEPLKQSMAVVETEQA